MHRRGPQAGDRAAYAPALEEAVKRAALRYASDAPVVFNVDFGHTDPQLVMPVGGKIRIDGIERRILVTY